ncbi:Serine protease inhibitor 27A [Eumeta japonica]|uniref:Serine protease inhibitor 27A n=1 Tax=Eumeta variegata TaxID=151549 RepID=A0A4C1Z1A3_EUMVA|nr:Serine protease inhibitor 27A [Eumeta japonica]
MPEWKGRVPLTRSHSPLALSGNVPIDPSTIQNVFGTSELHAAASMQTQATAIIAPPNETLVDPDYWDNTDGFVPSAMEYDRFDWTLTKRVAAFSNQNFLMSPLGLKLALAILNEAATGTTQAELASVLGFELDRNNIRRKFSTILNSLQTKSSQYILNLGSRIYLGTTAQPRQRFAAIAEEFYKTELKTIDFHNPPKAAAEINAWVANVTENRIQNLITEGDAANLVVLVLNTLFFKGSWRHPFAPNATKTGAFFVTPTEVKTTPFMTTRALFYYAESPKFDAKILRMPYLGHKFSMYLVVPNSLTGLPRVLAGISELRGEMYYLQERLVDVTIPKFKFEYKSLGIRQAFEDTASFPGIARGQLLTQRLHVSQVIQDAGIEINELGSVVYSATGSDDGARRYLQELHNETTYPGRVWSCEIVLRYFDHERFSGSDDAAGRSGASEQIRRGCRLQPGDREQTIPFFIETRRRDSYIHRPTVQSLASRRHFSVPS